MTLPAFFGGRGGGAGCLPETRLGAVALPRERLARFERLSRCGVQAGRRGACASAGPCAREEGASRASLLAAHSTSAGEPEMSSGGAAQGTQGTMMRPLFSFSSCLRHLCFVRCAFHAWRLRCCLPDGRDPVHAHGHHGAVFR